MSSIIKKIELTKTGKKVVFRGKETNMYLDNMTSTERLEVALMDYLGDDFVQFLDKNYDMRFKKGALIEE